MVEAPTKLAASDSSPPVVEPTATTCGSGKAKLSSQRFGVAWVVVVVAVSAWVVSIVEGSRGGCSNQSRSSVAQI